jgi:hypothetical protein
MKLIPVIVTAAMALAVSAQDVSDAAKAQVATEVCAHCTLASLAPYRSERFQLGRNIAALPLLGVYHLWTGKCGFLEP